MIQTGRSAVARVPWADVPAFHLAYLRSAAAAYRAGRITFEGRPSAISGTAWSWSGAGLVELGALFA